jgi:hypothetical protein
MPRDMRRPYISALILLAACDGQGGAQRTAEAGTNTPRQPAVAPPFSDYPVTDTSLGRPRPAAVDISSAPYGRMYRTKLTEGASAGPNFAGRYTVVLWGCGTGCQIISVVDARTGKLSEQTLLTAGGVRYRRDSRLLYADPPQPDQPASCASCGTPAFYEWREGRFHPVGTGSHPHLGGPRPWQAECIPGDTVPGSATGHYTCPERGG